MAKKLQESKDAIPIQRDFHFAKLKEDDSDIEKTESNSNIF